MAKAKDENQERLLSLFCTLNDTVFAGVLPPIKLSFNGRLKSSGGVYKRKKFIKNGETTDLQRSIEISKAYFTHSAEPWKDIEDTLGHEMIHYWLDFLGKPYGHTPEFKRKLKAHGFSRYSRLPRTNKRIARTTRRKRKSTRSKRPGTLQAEALLRLWRQWLT